MADGQMKTKDFSKKPPKKIDVALAKGVAPVPLSSFRTALKKIPAYRCIDLYNAIEELCPDGPHVYRIDSESEEGLNNILHGKCPKYLSRKTAKARRVAWPTGPEGEIFLPVDHFWVISGESQEDRLIIRLYFNDDNTLANLEVAARDLEAGEAFMESVISTSTANSIYRNQTLVISYETATRDEYGDIEKPEKLHILFQKIEPISDNDLIIDEKIRAVLLRNVVDLHSRRDLLKACKVPIRRGVLLYGPPGTGKTYACRYLCGKLPHTTRIMVAGSALLKVGQIFQIARLLQPTVVFFEDVDLVFMSREVNLYSSVLGELLDQMDGLRPFEDIGFVLTTNAIERMEAAVRDRPGRISQCIRFDPPNEALRRRYLAHYLLPYDVNQVDLQRLVHDSKGATQAFLKEWVHRAVQVGSERLVEEDDHLSLQTSDFEASLDEMRSFLEGTAERIIGFHSEK